MLAVTIWSLVLKPLSREEQGVIRVSRIILLFVSLNQESCFKLKVTDESALHINNRLN